MAVMGGGSRRKLPVTLIAVFVAIVGAVLWAVWRSPHRDDLSTFGAFAAAVVVPAVSLCVYVANFRKLSNSGRVSDELADSLAQSVANQWGDAARNRRLQPPIPLRWKASSRSVGGPLAAAVGSQQFPPLPGLPPTTQEQLLNGRIEDLHAVYGGLGSGRLVIIGSPGSGKSGTAVLLILAALQYRLGLAGAERARVPVPVMFTLHGWDSSGQLFKDWLVERLRQTYQLFEGRGGAVQAAALVTSNRIAVILDGFDEIPEELRPVVLQALSDQAGFRLVVLGRSDETAAAAKKEFLSGAVALELQDVDTETAADYLTNVQRDPPPAGWAELTGHLRNAPDSSIAKALSIPLTLTLVRDTYREGDDVRELLDFCAASPNVLPADIEDHLLDRVVPAAYKPRPGEQRGYDLPVAEHALTLIAQRMNREGTRDLAWWQIPAWTSRIPRFIATALLAGSMFGLLAMTFAEPSQALLVGIYTGFVCGFIAVRDRRIPWIARKQWRELLEPKLLWSSLGAGFLFSVVQWLISGPVIGLTTGFLAALLYWIFEGYGRTSSMPGGKNTSPLTPRESWRRERIFGLILGLAAVFVFGAFFALLVVIPGKSKVPGNYGVSYAGSAYGGPFGHFMEHYLSHFEGYFQTRILRVPGTFHWSKDALLLDALLIALVAGLCITLWLSRVWTVWCSFALLALLWRTPTSLLKFLDDACERDVLRTIGPVYQFRHARLQDRLAGDTALSITSQAPAAAQNSVAVGEVPPPSTN
jgi:hypothetical protein